MGRIRVVCFVLLEQKKYTWDKSEGKLEVKP